MSKGIKGKNNFIKKILKKLNRIAETIIRKYSVGSIFETTVYAKRPLKAKLGIHSIFESKSFVKKSKKED